MSIVEYTIDQNKVNKENFISFCDLFKLQVLKNPGAIAVTFEGSSFTYEELDFRATQLANFLRGKGVKAETIVALSLHNCLDVLVGILGILKSGGAYLPIDPNYPTERIVAMLEDAKPHILLTNESLKNKFSSLTYNIVLLNKVPSIEHISWEEAICPNQLAYVVYTSGSTGIPKGIMVEHKALSYAALTHQKLQPARLVSLVAGSISFDASLIVITHTLISGGKVCFPKSGLVVDPEQIISLMEKQKVNYTLCVPSFYSMLLDKSRNLPSLQRIDLGGENIPNAIPALHAKFATNATLRNVYGPSEYAIGATFAKIYEPNSKKVSKVTIGKPFLETQVYILNERLQQVSVGTKGEIFIGGPGLARGYINKEALTAEKFISVSLTNREPIRLFRTGDFGRFLLDGNIELLGRIDHQIKIRGFRIELGEIEYSISQYPGINEAIVIGQEEKDGHKRLVAYFSTLRKEDIAEKLRIHLKNALPQYMIPSTLIQMEKWPRTPNGKIDRAALPKFPESFLPKNALKKPLSELEHEIFQIWKNILGRDIFGVDDNFSELGGDSLQLACVQTQLKEVLGLEVSVSDLFQYPTISRLARHLTAENAEKALSSKGQELAKNQKLAFQRFRKFCKGA